MNKVIRLLLPILMISSADLYCNTQPSKKQVVKKVEKHEKKKYDAHGAVLESNDVLTESVEIVEKNVVKPKIDEEKFEQYSQREWTHEFSILLRELLDPVRHSDPLSLPYMYAIMDVIEGLKPGSAVGDILRILASDVRDNNNLAAFVMKVFVQPIKTWRVFFETGNTPEFLELVTKIMNDQYANLHVSNFAPRTRELLRLMFCESIRCASYMDQKFVLDCTDVLQNFVRDRDIDPQQKEKITGYLADIARFTKEYDAQGMGIHEPHIRAATLLIWQVLAEGVSYPIVEDVVNKMQNMEGVVDDARVRQMIVPVFDEVRAIAKQLSIELRKHVQKA